MTRRLWLMAVMMAMAGVSAPRAQAPAAQDAACNFRRDLPIRPGHTRRINCLLYTLNAAFGIGECARLLGKCDSGEQNVRVVGGLRWEDLLEKQEV